MAIGRKILFLGLSVIAAGAMALVAERREDPASGPAVLPSKDGSLTDLRELVCDFDIPVSFHTAESLQKIAEGVTVTPLDPEKCLAYLPILRNTLSLYPRGFLARTRVERFVVVRTIAWKSRTLAGLAMYDNRTIYLSAPSVDGRYRLGDDRNLSRRRVVHHEIFHFIDKFLIPRYDEKMWRACNVTGFRYGSGRKRMGIISNYAAARIGEDRAETYAAVMAGDLDLQERLIRDPYLSIKVGLLEDALRRVSPEFAERFHELHKPPSRASA